MSYGNTLIGIVERYINDKYSIYPDIHVNVLSYIDWIKRNIHDIHKNSIPST